MKPPITLTIPKYYNEKTVVGNRLMLNKTEKLVPNDPTQAQCIFSIEQIENYQCRIPEIEGEYRERATKFLHQYRANNESITTLDNGCKVYTYHWDDEKYHFRIYWIEISESHMLQVVGIFSPQYSRFYKWHFMSYFRDFKIDKNFNYDAFSPEKHFAIEYIPFDATELQGLIEGEKAKEEKQQFLKEHLSIRHPKFYEVLAAEMEENDEVTVENFLCTDWNLFYDIGNPENFSDPDSTLHYEDNSDLVDYEEETSAYNMSVRISLWNADMHILLLKNMVDNIPLVEQKLLEFFEHYTFGNGGGYADGIHYEWAKTEIERHEGTTYTNQDFLKRNVCLEDILFIEDEHALKLYFHCSWDTEHGITVHLDEKFNVTESEL